MKKTDTFFIISNFNTDPERYLKYCKDYHIYDQSTDVELKENLQKKYKKISFVKNTGHNISDYFRFFIDNYDNLPEYMMLAKGNMIGRHISQEFFEKVYGNKYYTLLYDDRKNEDKCGIAYQLYDGAFLEINNSWYASSKVHRCFSSFNELLVFLFKDPIIPEWVLFSPGACYIVSREQVRKYPAAFYKNLMELVSYTYFPSEAYYVERMLHIIFSGNYDLNDYCLTAEEFKIKIDELTRQSQRDSRTDKWFYLKIKNLRHKVRFKLQSQYRKLCKNYRRF